VIFAFVKLVPLLKKRFALCVRVCANSYVNFEIVPFGNERCTSCKLSVCVMIRYFVIDKTVLAFYVMLVLHSNICIYFLLRK